MIPIQKLLSRIRFDPEFGRGEFVLGIEDRFSPDIVRVPFKEVTQSPAGGHAITLQNDEGERVSIPLHRIVEVTRNGEVIWERPRQTI